MAVRLKNVYKLTLVVLFIMLTVCGRRDLYDSDGRLETWLPSIQNCHYTGFLHHLLSYWNRSRHQGNRTDKNYGIVITNKCLLEPFSQDD